MNVWNSLHAPKDLDSASRDHGESSSTPINAISTKCSLSLVNEARREDRAGREDSCTRDEDHCFLIMWGCKRNARNEKEEEEEVEEEEEEEEKPREMHVTM